MVKYPTQSGVIGFPLLADAERMFANAQFDKAAQATIAHLR